MAEPSSSGAGDVPPVPPVGGAVLPVGGEVSTGSPGSTSPTGATGPTGPLDRQRRLRRRQDFEQIRTEGRVVHGRFFKLNFRLLGEEARVSQLGVITTRRVGMATRRVALRRVVREFFRAEQSRMVKKAGLVVIPKSAAADVAGRELRDDLLKIWKKAGLI